MNKIKLVVEEYNKKCCDDKRDYLIEQRDVSGYIEWSLGRSGKIILHNKYGTLNVIFDEAVVIQQLGFTIHNKIQIYMNQRRLTMQVMLLRYALLSEIAQKYYSN